MNKLLVLSVVLLLAACGGDSKRQFIDGYNLSWAYENSDVACTGVACNALIVCTAKDHKMVVDLPPTTKSHNINAKIACGDRISCSVLVYDDKGNKTPINLVEKKVKC